MKSDELKFLEKDVDYWEIQMMVHPTELTKESLEMAKQRLEEYNELP